MGPNGAGKTNLLEGVHVATQGFSPRTRAESRLIQTGCTSARAIARTSALGRQHDTSLTLHRSGPKEAELNGAPATLDTLRTQLPVLVFLPDRLAVVKGAPAVRRTYFDRMLGRVHPERVSLPGEYAQALSQRGAALRRVREGLAPHDSIEPWTEALARLGQDLDAARTELVSQLNPHFESACATLSMDAATVAYVSSELSAAALEQRVSRDIERGTTGVGPHLRDFTLRTDAGDLRAYGSQGQQRAAVLALLLAEATCLGERGRPPALLLDDVLSELDRDRRVALVSLLGANTQALVTATDRDDVVEAACVVEVAHGTARIS